MSETCSGVPVCAHLQEYKGRRGGVRLGSSKRNRDTREKGDSSIKHPLINCAQPDICRFPLSSDMQRLLLTYVSDLIGYKLASALHSPPFPPSPETCWPRGTAEITGDTRGFPYLGTAAPPPALFFSFFIPSLGVASPNKLSI